MSHIKSRKRAGLATAGLALGMLPAMAAETPADAKDQVMPPIRAGSGDAPAYKAEMLQSPKFTQPLIDTPQTVTVIRKELIQQQKATTLTEALRNSPGITLQLGENGNTQTGDAIFMRGFDTQNSIFVDNIRDLGGISRDMFNIEQVEVVKGPSGADNGRGASSGYVNLESKVPTRRNAASGEVMLGSAGRVRLTADLNRSLDLALPGAGVRLNVMKDDGGVPGRDEVKKRSWGIAPSLALGLGTPTRTYFNLLHLEQDNKRDGGIPTVGLPGYIPAAGVAPNLPEVDRENYYGSRDDFEHIKLDMATVRFEHDLSPKATLRNITRLGHSEQFYMLTGVNALVPPADPADFGAYRINRSRQFLSRRNEVLTNQTHLAIESEIGGMKNHFAGGVEFIHEKQFQPTYVNATAGAVPTASLYHPSLDDAFAAIDLQRNGAYTQGSTLTAALYGFDTLALSERWKVNAGLRWERYKTDTRAVTLSTAAANPTLPVGTPIPLALDRADDLFSWKVGVLFKPAPHGTIYASAANSLQPPGGANFSLSAAANNANNPSLDAQEGTNYEVGTKWDLLDGKLAVAAAVFRSTNRKELIEDSTAPGTYVQVGERRVEGVELSAAGQLTPAWDITAGLAWMDPKITAGPANTNGLIVFSPKLTFTTWTTYRLPSGLTVGGGVRYVDSVARTSNVATATTTGVLEVPDHWVADAMVSYALNRQVTLQANVNNIADKKYVAAVNNGGSRYVPGAPRSFQVSANFRF